MKYGRIIRLQTSTNGGSLNVDHTGIASTQQIDLGGQDATTLSFDPPSSVIAGQISGFAESDRIDLLNFVGLVVKTGNIDPKLDLIVTDGMGILNSVGSLQLIGDYTKDTFGLSTDAAGTGNYLTVHPSP